MTRPWTTVAHAKTHDGALELKRRGEETGDWMITLDGRVLMTSARHRSEDDLARQGCGHLGAKRNAHVLVSGLGMGFTLRAALAVLARTARVTVVEINGVVARWCRDELGGLTDHAVGDPRVTVRVDDVSRVIAQTAKSAKGSLDAVVLDMYEGPPTKVRADDPLYGTHAIANTAEALAPGGVLAVWCEQPSLAFERTLRANGFEVTCERAGRGGSVHPIYVAKRRARDAKR